jgi:hypothetical protein
MKSSGPSRYALAIGAAFVLLAGCGGSQPRNLHLATADALLCDHKENLWIDAGEYLRVTSFRLDGSNVRISLEYGLMKDALKRVPTARLDARDGISYTVDSAPLLYIYPLNRGIKTRIVVGISDLRNGDHRLRLSLAGRDNSDNFICFSTPGNIIAGAGDYWSQ